MPQPIASLAELVAPLSPDAFRDLLAARTPRHIPGDPARASRHAALFDWDGLVGGMRDGVFPPRYTRIYRDRVKVPRLFLRDASADRAELIDRLLAADASIILNSAERFVPTLGRLCSAVAGETRDHVSAVAIATSGQGGALERHWDEYDIVVLQVDGAKKWSLYGEPVVNPVGAMDRTVADDGAPPVFEVVLQPGDWLYVPAGWQHQCDTHGARSLHLGVLLYPFSAVRAAELIAQAMIADPGDRAPLRFDLADASAAEAALRRRLIERIEKTPIEDLVRIHQSTGAAPDAET